MAAPGVTVKMAFASDALDSTPTFTDVSAYVIAFSSRRGRSNVQDKYAAGTFSVTFDNTLDGRFDAANSSGAYAGLHTLGGIRPMVQTTIDSGGTRLFTGWTERWVQNYSAPYGATTTVTGKDLMSIIGPKKIASTTRASETTEARFDDLCGTRVGLPAAWYNARYNSNILMSETTYGVSARAHLTAIENSEGGYAFVAADGVLTFDGRYSFFQDTKQLTATMLFEDNSTASPGVGETIVRYGDVSVVQDLDLLFTEVEASNGTYAITIQNSTQYAALGPISLSVSNQCELWRQVDDNAQWLVSQYAVLSPRIESAVVDVLAASGDEYDAARNIELRDLVWLGHTPPGGGDRFATYHNVEGISHSVSPSAWKTTFTLGDAHRYAFAGYGAWYTAGDNITPNDSPVASM